MNRTFKEAYIMEKFSEMGAAKTIAKWLKASNTIVISQEFTHKFIAKPVASYADYKELARWCIANNVVLVDKKFWDTVRSNLLKDKV
jgi:hypothetical protein